MKKRVLFWGFILYSASLFVIGAVCVAKRAGSAILRKQQELEKHQKLFLVLDAWVKKKQQGKSMECFLKRNGYHSVAIYGLGNIGKLLEDELRGSIKISYGIDRKNIPAEFPVYKPEDDLPEADVVVVTAAYEFEEIECMLKKKLSCPIYSIEDVIYFMD